MREVEFRTWLDNRLWEGSPLTKKAKDNRVRRTVRAERGLPGLGFEQTTLESVFDAGLWEALITILKRLKDDPAADLAVVRSVVPQAEEPRGQLANMIAALRQYRNFLEGRDPNYDGVDYKGDVDETLGLTKESVEAAMLEYDRGATEFMANYGFATNFDYVLRRPGEQGHYPAKAVFCVAYSAIPGNSDITGKDRNTFSDVEGGPIHSEFVRLGYEVFNRRRSPDDQTIADDVRKYVIDNYIDPARRRMDATVTVRAGDVHKALGLSNQLPNVCQAIEGAKLQDLTGLAKPEIVSGPASGRGSKMTYRFATLKNSRSKGRAMPPSTNLILYGPPGTGKTYRTAREAVALCDGRDDYPETKEGRAALMTRYSELVRLEQIGFVTFHQNYGYEDFVEGLRPTTYGEDGEPLASGFRLAPEAGIFTKISERAEALHSAGDGGYDFEDKRIFKMSLGEVANPEDDYLFEEAIAGGFVHMGGDGGMDWSEPVFTNKDLMIAGYAERHPDEPVQHPNSGVIEFPFRLRVRARVGDLVIVSKGNLLFRAIGEITGDYHQVKRENDDYTMRRSVKWLWIDRDGVGHDVIYGKRFSQRTIYEFTESELKLEAIRALIDAGKGGADDAPGKQFVLIIDEINRANVSKVFGELITLLEPDKRAGKENALSVTLPYSKRPFSVPANLHIIGTMNTADRSIALLDTALRRRFDFREMAPEPHLLSEASGRTAIDLVAALTTINQRIEYLIDREHRIGHAFFIGCRTAEQVEAAMRDKVIPLLQEYFFEDWSRIHAVLGDGFIREGKLDPPPGIDGDFVSSWSVLSSFKPDAFDRLTGNAVSTPEVTGE